MPTILGFMNYASHDPGACIVTDRNGKLEYVTISDERLSRVKNSYFFPARAIKYCMDYFQIKSLEEVDYVITDYGFHPQMSNTTRHYRKLEADFIKMKLDLDFSRLVYAESHHTAHAASVFYASGFGDAAVLVVDGFGSRVETNSIYVADYEQGIRPLAKYHGQGIGLVYTAVTNDVLDFGVAEEGKTMGLAPVGRNVSADPILRLNPAYEGIVTDFSEFMDRAPFSRLKQQLPRCPNKDEVTNEFYSRIAFELQQETERCILHLANFAYQLTGKKRLCFAGGVALNCVANEYILPNTPFEELFVQPASSDTGVPLGLALWGWSKYVGQPQIEWEHAYTGVRYDSAATSRLLDDLKIPYRKSNACEVAEMVAQGQIVGWFVDGSEVGPRALGHRSILADPRFAETKDIINAKVKHREMYRPFAPSVLEEYAKEYFNMSAPDSPYMLLAPLVHEDRKDKIPAVVHVDGTSRVHTVTKKSSPKYHAVISEFYRITGVPVVLNTSFNDNGEPIVETPLDALLCFLRTSIDYLYLDGLLIRKTDIADNQDRVEALENIRSSKARRYYEDAIKMICRGYSTEELQGYLKAHIPMHQYYQKLHPYVELQTKIHSELAKYEHFVTDEYHVDIIKRYLPEEYHLVKPRLRTIPDCKASERSIPRNSFVVLYNLSLYVKDDTRFNFYELHHMKITPPYEDKESYRTNYEISNEYCSNKDWDAFYLNHIL